MGYDKGQRRIQEAFVADVKDGGFGKEERVLQTLGGRPGEGRW